MVAPVLEKLEETNENIKFYKCNIDESPEISKLLSIRSIPTVIFVKDGRIKDFIVGARPAPFYEKKITEHFDS
jgi:thioredoxin 1